MKLVNLVSEIPGRLKVGPISLDIEPGTILGITGASGAGKTTLLRGMCAPDDPRTCVAGEVRDVVGRIAYLPQRLLLPTGYTASGFLRAIRNRGRTDNVLERLRLTGIRDQRVGHLSGGEAQRLLLAAAVVSEPTYLLVDEPFSALDFLHKVIVANYIRELVDGGQIGSVVIVSHDLDIILSILDKLIVIRRRGSHTFHKQIPVRRSSSGKQGDLSPVSAGIRKEVLRWLAAN